jgi:hypothetical protein
MNENQVSSEMKENPVISEMNENQVSSEMKENPVISEMNENPVINEVNENPASSKMNVKFEKRPVNREVLKKHLSMIETPKATIQVRHCIS